MTHEELKAEWKGSIQQLANELIATKETFFEFKPPEPLATNAEQRSVFNAVCNLLEQDAGNMGLVCTMTRKRIPGEHSSQLVCWASLDTDVLRAMPLARNIGSVVAQKTLKCPPTEPLEDNTQLGDLHEREAVYNNYPVLACSVPSHIAVPHIIDEALRGMLGGDQKTIALAGLTLIEKLLQKNLDYGSAALSSPLLLPGMDAGVAIRVRMSDKIRRIYQLSQNNPRIKSESIDDSLDDLVGYHILSKALVSQKPKVVHGSHGYDIGTSEKLEYGG